LDQKNRPDHHMTCSRKGVSSSLGLVHCSGKPGTMHISQKQQALLRCSS